MPTFEPSDPNEGRTAFLMAVESPAGRDNAVPSEEIAMLLGRLRDWPEIPDAIAAEAQARWDADHDGHGLILWLKEALAYLDEPEVIDCDCGQLLVDPAEWTGEAVVVCDRCAAKFGVSVAGPDSWSMWALLDPRS